MSDTSDLQHIVSMTMESNYVTLGIITAVVYDYILTFPDEVEYIWNKPWTRVSTLYILVRYCGVCSMMINLTEWLMFLFTAAADLTMILRVWAIYMQSRIILGILLTLYVLEIVSSMIAYINVSIKFTAVPVQVLDFSFCLNNYVSSPVLADVLDGVRFPLAATMCLLVAAQFIRQSLQMYAETKQWQPGRYMNLFVREGLLYFLAVFLFALCDLLLFGTNIPIIGWQGLLLMIVQYVPVITLSPRCILSVRALYERDGRGQRGHNLDNGFGFTTMHECSVDEMMFAPGDVERPEEDGLEQHDEIQMGELGVWNAGSGV
ncbi:hypothetical protein L210DRAFT_2052888 [Boletus edulis BED1]|uniref:DUF6533 domain-containing protein n=1 Tax=Boletus edulis BED1 TaxID=1328754 RepID=A0AAD4C981_BOLED|nr:hypothetical protein L210DRAFT_2052888 [Boletus edulis BED1]